MKYIIVTGSVMSGIGKGITASSIGVCLKACGLSVTAIKIDPYLNVDSGTMSPFEHGECYVLNDGGETDLDLGNYERFLDINLTKDHNITSGKIYNELIRKERKGDYLGKTVQVVPHFTNLVKEWIHRVAKIPVGNGVPQICIIELGGTVGDIESAPFVEAIRQMIDEDVLLVNVTYLVKLKDEIKTKPSQQGIKILRENGLNPDVLCVRSEGEITDDIKQKLSNFCHIPESHIFANPDVSNIYQVPLLFKPIVKLIDPSLKYGSFWDKWTKFANNFYIEGRRTKKIAIVGKYVKLADSYLSLTNAIKHTCIQMDVNCNIELLDCDNFDHLDYDAVIIPGGFGYRGIEGMIKTAQICRENGIPCLGICLGFQVMVIEYARNVLGLKGANSTEFDPDTPHPVIRHATRVRSDPSKADQITIIEENENMGGTMRLGLQKTMTEGGELWERHRHRYEFNPDYLFKFMKSGFKFVGWNEMKIDMIQIGMSSGVQFHPEYTSRPGEPNRAFLDLLTDRMWTNGQTSYPKKKGLNMGYLWGHLKQKYPEMKEVMIVEGQIYMDDEPIESEGLLKQFCLNN